MPDVPLVVPEVNGRRRARRSAPHHRQPQLHHHSDGGGVARPSSDVSHIRRVHVATYQSASGAGAAGDGRTGDGSMPNWAQASEPTVEKFAFQLAYNVIPHIDVFTDNDYTKEEMKMFHETRKIMHSDIAVSATCVRVPGDACPQRKASGSKRSVPSRPTEARAAFSKRPRAMVRDGRSGAARSTRCRSSSPARTPSTWGVSASDVTNPNGLAFWCVSDQITQGCGAQRRADPRNADLAFGRRLSGSCFGRKAD